MSTGYNFGSTGYVSAFGRYPVLDGATLRRRCVEAYDALEASLPGTWGDADPVRTVVAGKEVSSDGDRTVDTVNAFGTVNGRQILSSAAAVDSVISHLVSYRPPERDLRRQVREAEAEFLSTHAAALAANQAVDFQKQDSITELEESIEANFVERTLNDQLFDDELAGRISIGRLPAFVGAVSNFSNFLDLFRKTLRSLELGVPCAVLSRSNTTQHMYRWFQLLRAELQKRGVDEGMLTYISCDIPQQQRIMAACKESPLYLTGSRQVAELIKGHLRNTVASTGGPNTMVAANGATPTVQQAIRWSVGIENSGQCTAMRHLVAPGLTPADVDAILAPMEADVIASPKDSLATGGFAGLFVDDAGGWGASFDAEGVATGYTRHSRQAVKAAYRVGAASELPYGIEEHWRRVYLDVTSPASSSELRSEAFVSELARWLVVEQPISLAINGDSAADGYPLAMRLFEQTGLVVYSVGEASSGQPTALTAQARPQDGEIFGEFPPRRQLGRYTRFPVCVPSSTPSYNSEYEHGYLTARSGADVGAIDVSALASQVRSSLVRGYTRVLADYLADACGPKDNLALDAPSQGRTAVWGIQRPPLNGTRTVLRCDDGVSFDDIAAQLLPFWATTAREQLLVSCAPGAAAAAAVVRELGGVELREGESAADFESASSTAEAWNVVRPARGSAEDCFPLAGQAISLLFGLGHIKSTRKGDAEFVRTFRASRKWLQCREELLTARSRL